jgi:hypothetical protein
MMFEDETTVAWTAMAYRAPVIGADGTDFGTAESLLGDEKEDIFHGIVLKFRHDGRLLEVPAQRIKRITEKHVVTDLTAGEAASLPAYKEERWLHLGWGGLFRKHPEWDSTKNP